MKQRRCTRTSPSSCYRTTLPRVASQSTTSSVYVATTAPGITNTGHLFLFTTDLWPFNCFFLLSSGRMDRRPSRSRRRTARPPAWQACYESVAADSTRVITSSRLMPGDLLWDHCSWDSRGLFLRLHAAPPPPPPPHRLSATGFDLLPNCSR